MMHTRKLGNLAFICGILALLFYFSHDLIGGLLYPGYSWMTQAVSDITSDTSPSRMVAGILTKGYGLFAILCCIFTRVLLQKEKRVFKVGTSLFLAMNLVSAVGYTLFPLSDAGLPSGFQNVMHIVVTVFVVLLSIASLLTFTIGGFLHKERFIALFSLLAFLFMMAGAIGSNVAPRAVFGIVERFSTYAAAAFTVALGYFGKRKDNI